ncbi:MAG: autotransporter outer membrane beta-barrel domain-containing protein [Phreatobacter sp.]
MNWKSDQQGGARHALPTLRVKALASCSLLALGLMVHGPAAAQSVSSTGDVTPAPSGAATWTPGTMVNVGLHSTGTLTITGGGTATTDGAVLGSFAGSNGTATVDGAGSHWNTGTGSFFVGSTGTGLLTISGGATIETHSGGLIGNALYSHGTVNVSGAGSAWSVQYGITVGGQGAGTLNITDGATVTSRSGVIAANASSATGNVLVTGAGSTWNTGNIDVGGFGPGTLAIANGGLVATTPGSTVRLGSSWADGPGRLVIGSADLNDRSATAGTLTADKVVLETPGKLIFNYTTSSDYRFDTKITGSGAIEHYSGATILTADSSGFTGTTNVTGGALTVNGALGGKVTVTSGSLAIANGGVVTASPGWSVTVGGATGAATLYIGPVGNYSPTVTAGTLQADNLILNSSGKLVFNHWTWSEYKFAPTITGSGAIETQAGATILTADSSGFTGTTKVQGGALIVNGALGGTVTTVNGVLAGTGTVGTLNANNVIAPGAFYTWGAGTGGNEIGTLTVTGNATFSRGASLYINVSATAADRLAVGGTATLAGNLILLPVGTGFKFNTPYTILTAAGGINGTFDRTDTWGSFGAVRTSVTYGANDIFLTLDPNALSPLLPAGTAANPTRVAGAIDRAVLGGANGSALLPLYLQTPAGLVVGLNSLSGEAATGAQTAAFGASSMFLNMMLDPMAGSRGATSGGAAPSLIQMADLSNGRPRAVAADQGWGVWTKAFAQSNRIDGDAAAGAARTSGGLFGIAAGADKRLTPNTVVGFALAGGGTNYGLGSGRGSGAGDLFQAGLYGSTKFGDGYVSAAIAYGWNSFDVTRNVTIGATQAYNSRFTGQTYGGRVETGWRFQAAAFGWTPYAALEAIGYSSPRYGETSQGAAPFALTYAAKSSTALRTELGVRLDGRTRLETGELLTYGRLAWAYQARADRTVEAQFETLANSSFTVFGARPSMHTALATIGAELKLQGGVRLTTSLDGELGTRHQAIRANAGLRYEW